MFTLTETSDRTFEWSAGLSTAGSWVQDVDPWVQWNKSSLPGCQFIDVFLVGAGGGGSGGFTKAVGGAGGGGGGGGSGGTCRARFPLFLLPETVYFYLPQGGRGGAAGAGGGVGGRAAMTLRPALANPTVAESFMVSSGVSTTATTGATAGAVGGSGGGGTTASLVNCVLSCLAISIIWVGGQPGVNGGAVAGAAGGGINDTTNMFIGGCGGAGSTSAAFAGGVILTRGNFPQLNGGSAPNDAESGWTFMGGTSILCSSGGTGGGSTNTAATAGGAGGNAGIGCGGGGGGAGVSTGGRGGNGGDSYLMLVGS